MHKHFILSPPNDPSAVGHEVVISGLSVPTCNISQMEQDLKLRRPRKALFFILFFFTFLSQIKWNQNYQQSYSTARS